MPDSNLGVPPQAPSPPRDATRSTSEQARFRARLALALTTTPLLVFGACQIGEALSAPSWVKGALFWSWFGTVALCLAAIVLAFLSIRAARQAGLNPSWEAWVAIVLAFLSPIATFTMAIATTNFSRGRALRRRGRAHLPELRLDETTTSNWLARPSENIPVSWQTSLPEEVVDGWLANAKTEVASVAAFSHLATELLAVGAPARLVEGALRAALEEVEHAKICFSIAGSSHTVAQFAEAASRSDRVPTWVTLARDSIVEACLFEHASALVAQDLARRSDVPPQIASALARIANEEASHAEHGWQIVEHALERSDAPKVLAHVLAELEDAVKRARPATLRDGLESFGLAGTKAWEDAVTKSAQHVRSRLKALGASLAEAA